MHNHRPLAYDLLFLSCKHLLFYWHIIVTHSTGSYKDIFIQVPREIIMMSGSVREEVSTLYVAGIL